MGGGACSDDERATLDRQENALIRRRQRFRVGILLRPEAGITDAEIAEEIEIPSGTGANVRRRFASGGLDSALNETLLPEPIRPTRASAEATRNPSRHRVAQNEDDDSEREDQEKDPESARDKEADLDQASERGRGLGS